jgi:hypothetical protein
MPVLTVNNYPRLCNRWIKTQLRDKHICQMSRLLSTTYDIFIRMLFINVEWKDSYFLFVLNNDELAEHWLVKEGHQLANVIEKKMDFLRIFKILLLEAASKGMAENDFTTLIDLCHKIPVALQRYENMICDFKLKSDIVDVLFFYIIFLYMYLQYFP